MKKDLSVPWSSKAAMKFISIITVLMMVVGLVSSTVAFAAPVAEETDPFGPIVRQAVKSDLSPPLRSITPTPPEAADGEILEIPSFSLPKTGGGGSASPDLDVQTAIGEMKMPPTIVNFEGVDNRNAVLPPDTQGDVGPNHYVQIVNLSFAVWDKSGTLLYGPVNNNTVWSGFGGDCETHNNGDPIVLYDQFADRWLISQFALDFWTDFHECIAISQTPDPTGAWYRYDFLYSTSKMNDYPKFGVWPDGYYMTVNQFVNPGIWAGAGVVAYERDAMLVGDPNARAVSFDLATVDMNYGGMLPSDFDGTILPPAGSPNYFAEWDDSTWIGPNDSVRIWEFHVDWTNPANSTFGIGGDPNYVVDTSNVDPDMCGGSRNCIPQPGGSAVDAIDDRLMYRLQYRNFNGYETLVANHTVDVGGDHAGIHWMELRDSGSGWVLQQDGVYAPDSDHRWMGSIAMDRDGNIALGYSVSSTQTYPSIRYTGRMAGDPLGTMPQGEASVIAGSGYQTHSSGRWGDYSMMSVDPVDDCTFWYTQEYYAQIGSAPWQTRIGAFQFPTCVGEIPDIHVDPGSFNFEVSIGDTDAAVMTIHNLGGADLTFDMLDEKTSQPAPSGQMDEPESVVDPGLQNLSTTESLDLPSPISADPYAAGDVIQSWGSGLLAAWGVAYDSVDNSVWVSSPHANWGGDDYIYEYTPAGVLTGRVYPHTLPHANGPADVAYNWNTGKMWIMNVNTGVNNCIHEIDPVSGYTGASICPGGGTGFSTSQRGLAYDPVTDTYFAGSWNDLMIYRFAPDGTILEQVNVGLPTSGLAYNPDTQHLFAIVNADPNPIYVLDAANNYNILGQFNISTGFGAYSGAGLEIDCEGNLWAVDQLTAMAYEIDSGETTSVCFEDALWLTESPTSGSVPPGGNQPVDVMVDTAGLGLGTYTANIVIFNNDPDENPTIVPVTLEVVPQMPDIEVDPTSVSSAQPPDTVSVKSLDILNVGSADLLWDIFEEMPDVVIPASGDDFPRGTDPPSYGVFSGNGSAASSPSGRPFEGLLAPGSDAFGSEGLSSFFAQFDLDVPEVLNSVAPYPQPPYIYAGDFFGADFSKAYVIRDDNVLVTLDTVTGVETVIGAVPIPPDGDMYTGMAYDPTTGTMYASSCNISASRLYIVDLFTPTTILVGEITGSPCTIAIGVNDAGQMYGQDIVNDVLMSIDKATGAGTVIGSLGFDANYAQGMDFDSATGQLYLAAYNNSNYMGELRIADTATGATALVGVLGQTSHGVAEVTWLGNASGGGCIEGDIPWVSVSPTSGTTPPAGVDTLDVAFDSAGLGAGAYNGNLCITSNDPDEALVVVPVELIVETEPPDIEVDPTSVSSIQPPDWVEVKPLDINNVGGEDLTWEVIEELPAVSIPASGDDFPRGSAAPSYGLPTGSASAEGSSAGEPLEGLLSPGSSAYATETQYALFTQLDLDIPEVLNTISPYTTTFIWSGDFVGADFTKVYAIREDNILLTLETATGAETVIGTVPAPPNAGEIYTGMAYDPTTDTMYASSCDLLMSHLYIVDLVTPTTTLIGEITNSPCSISIAVDDVGQMYGEDLVNDVLIGIDKVTGAGTVIGSLGFDANFGQGMDFDSASGQLYLAAFNGGTFQAELRIADTATGATSLVGVIGQTTPGGTVQLGWVANAGVSCISGDIPWVSVSPTMGTTPPGGTSNLDVTFDSTGLSAGSYAGNLCVLSNDPDEPVVFVPLDLEVVQVGDADLWIEPPSDEVAVGSTTSVDIMVADVTDLYGVELELTYDPAIVEVVGAQLIPGSCPVPDFIVLNDAVGGTIRYAVTSLSPSPPCTGGVVASIVFQGLAEGISPVTFTSWILADTDGLPIGVESVTDGEVVVISAGTIDGYVELQGRTDHSGAEVCGTAGGPPICTTTDASGYYLLELPQDTYDVTVEMDCYLDGLKTGMFVPAGGTVSLPSVKLLGGDANEDETVNILDLSLIGGKFGLSEGDPGWDGRADINNDLTINILDVVLAASNFLNTSPVPWP